MWKKGDRISYRDNAGRVRKGRVTEAPYKKRATWSELAALLSEEAQAPREELPPPFYDEGTGTYRKKPLPLPFGRDRSDLRSRSRMLPPEWAEKIGEAAQLRKEEMSVLRGVVASRSFRQGTVNTLTKIAEGPVSQEMARAIYEKLAPRNVPSWEQQKAARFYTSTASVAVGAPDIQLPAKRVMGVLDPSAIVPGRVSMATGGSADRTPPRSMSIMGLLSEVEERSAQLGRRWDVSTAAVFERDSDNRVVLSRDGEPSIIGGYYAQFPESERLGKFKAYLVEELERLRRLVDTRASLASCPTGLALSVVSSPGKQSTIKLWRRRATRKHLSRESWKIGSLSGPSLSKGAEPRATRNFWGLRSGRDILSRRLKRLTRVWTRNYARSQRT
jgi:hypothetical protein